MRLLKRLRPWVVMVLVISVTAFTIGATTSNGGGGGVWLLAGALFHGIFIALLVWSEGHTPSSAWRALHRPPREGL